MFIIYWVSFKVFVFLNLGIDKLFNVVDVDVDMVIDNR